MVPVPRTPPVVYDARGGPIDWAGDPDGYKTWRPRTDVEELIASANRLSEDAQRGLDRSRKLQQERRQRQRTPVSTPRGMNFVKTLHTINTWQEAELSAAAWMKRSGYPDAHPTPPGPDGGIDVMSSRGIGQVKYWQKPVGAEPIYKLAAAARRSHLVGRDALFFSAAGYTSNARAAARACGVELYQLGLDGRSWTRLF